MWKKPVCYETGEDIQVFNGVPSFMGVPVASADDLPYFDIAVMGVPWEGVVTWGAFSGCELATKSIRTASKRYNGFLPETGYDFFDYLRVCDFGDVQTTPGNIQVTMDSIYAQAHTLYTQGLIPITFGGDHSITAPIVAAMADNTQGKIGIVHFDAHMDNIDIYDQTSLARCSPLYRIYESIDPVHIIHVGIRGPRNSAKQADLAREKGAAVLTSFEVKEKGVAYAVNKALEVAGSGTEAIYVTVCSDILEAAYNPGGPPDINGLSPFELSSMLYRLASSGVSGFDYTEVYPPSDINNLSSHTAAWMAMYVLSGLVKHKHNM